MMQRLAPTAKISLSGAYECRYIPSGFALWAADVWLWTLNQTMEPISGWAEVEGYSSKGEAEEAGLRLGIERVDKWVLSGK